MTWRNEHHKRSAKLEQRIKESGYYKLTRKERMESAERTLSQLGEVWESIHEECGTTSGDLQAELRKIRGKISY